MSFLEEAQAKVQDLLSFIEKREVEHERHISYLSKENQRKDRLIARYQTNMDLIRIGLDNGIEPLGSDEPQDNLDSIMEACLGK
jgi:hypothetical protein